MINHEDNPEYLNSFLDYTMTILNKSPNTVKEYNYDLATFLKFIKMHFGLTTEEDFSKIEIKDVDLNTIKKIKLDDIHAFLSYLTTTYHSKAATRARKVSSIRVFFNYLCAKANLIENNPAQNLETPKLDRRLPKYLSLEDSQKLLRTPDGKEFATITNVDVTKEAFLVKYEENIEIVFNYYNKTSKEMETYENELFDMSKINSKEELIEKMKDMLEHFEEKFNKLEQDEENMEV